MEALPTGRYPVVITASQEKPTRAGTGSFTEFEMTVQGGEYNGRKLYTRLNLKNPNQQAVDIAYAELSAICHVTGRLHIQDSSQLHGAPFIVLAKKLPRGDTPPGTPPDAIQYTNEIGGYFDMNGNEPGHAGTVSSPGAQPQWAGQQPQQMPPQYQQPQGAPPQQFQQPPQQQAPQYQAPPQQMPGQPPAWANGGGAPAQQMPPQQPQQFQQPPQQQMPQQQMPQQGAPAGQTPPPWAAGGAS